LKAGKFLIRPPLSEFNTLAMSKWNGTVNLLTHWEVGYCGLAIEYVVRGLALRALKTRRLGAWPHIPESLGLLQHSNC
jgi:hypothetical protein